MFRTARGVVVPVATVLVAVAWTTGTMVLLGSAINMGTIVLTPLLIVIGVASGIHLVSEYYLELRPDRSARDVVRAVLEHVRAPIAIAALTTLIGFAALIPTPIQSIRRLRHLLGHRHPRRAARLVHGRPGAPRPHAPAARRGGLARREPVAHGPPAAHRSLRLVTAAPSWSGSRSLVSGASGASRASASRPTTSASSARRASSAPTTRS